MKEDINTIEAAAAKSKAQYGELGQSGTLIFNGIITGEEYSPDLTGRQAVTVYDRMRRSDATVRASLTACYLPILQAEYKFEPASTDALDVEIAEFCDQNFFEILDWHGFLSEALTFLPFGFSVFEMVFGMRKVNGKDRIVLTKLAFRKQKTIYKWSSDKFPNGGITQLIASGGTPETPMEKLVVFTNQKEGDNYEGISVLRSSYQSFFIKSMLYQIDSVAHERHALGVLDITEPAQADPNDRATLIRAARNLRANEQSYINHKAGWLIAWMDMKAGTLRDMQPSISHHDRQISKNVLTQFLELGAKSSGGSRALSEDHTTFFTLAEKATAKVLIDTLMKTAVKAIIDLNYTVDKYPKLKVTGLDDENLTIFADAFEKIVGAGGVTIDLEVENRSRALLGFAPLAEGEQQTKPQDTPAPTDKSGKPTKDQTSKPGDKLPPKTKAAIVQAERLYSQLNEALHESRAA